jgi:hypothetical protein
MSAKQLVYLRAGASALITGLAVIYSLYPSYTWITAVIAAAATLGIHAIPAVGQSTGGNTMSETPEIPQPTTLPGSILMGVQPVAPVTLQPAQPVQAPTVPVAPVEAPVTPEAPEAVAWNATEQEAPVAAPVEPVTVRTAPVDAPSLTVADKLRALADELDGS